MNTFKVFFFSPDNQIIFDKIVSISINGLEGELMVLAHHSPYLIYLIPGIITVKMNNRKKEKIVLDRGGVLEVANCKCNIIANRVQVFDCMIHDEKLLKNKSMNIRLSYYS
ncbi:MAG: F0F1 ATP synthase subunit epsilon [Wolbachia endosymbiont of Meromenopon meropis]|nr:F0F1 ATP synthase subunit epsilon [Wolbachia endosymbiont of Meromenopon meropis]